MKLLIQNGEVFDGEQIFSADVLIEDGQIAKIEKEIAPAGARVVDAGGRILSPGFIDLHVHLRQPGFEAKETIATGTAAAAAGGFTTVCSMPNVNPVPDDPEGLQPQLDAIRADALVRVLAYGALTQGQQGAVPADIPALAGRVCGFSDDGRGVQGESVMREAMRQVAAADSFVAAHCELESLIPAGAVTVQENCAFAQKQGFTGVSAQSEWAEVERDIRLAKETGCRLHICHTSTAQSFALVRRAKAEGLPVSCEVTPHNLLLCCDDITEDDGRFKMNPPLRTKEDQLAAIQALCDGTVDAIATDHAPHTLREKDGGFAKSMNGIVGLETAFAVLYTKLVLSGQITLQKLLSLLSGGPARVLGRAPGRLQPGKPADLVLLDLGATRVVNPEDFKSKGRATPFAGWRLSGWPALTLVGGRVAWQAL